MKNKLTLNLLKIFATSVIPVFGVIICAILLTGCSLDYSTTEEDGEFSYAVGKKKAFVYEYIWDGEEDSMTVIIPRKYDGKEIIGIGGFYGRGLPMKFKIDASAYIDANIAGIGAAGAGESADTGRTGAGDTDAEYLQKYEVSKVDRKVQLNFLVLYRGELKEGIEAMPQYSEYVELDGKVTEFEYNVDIRPKKDAKNGITPGITVIEDNNGGGNGASGSGNGSDVYGLSGIFTGADEAELNIYNGNDNILIFLNPDGSLYKKIDLKDLVPKLFGSWLGISFGEAYEHSIYFVSYRDDDQAVFEYNIDNESLNRIYRGIVHYPNVSIYDGSIYMDDSYYDSLAEHNIFTTTKLSRNKSGGFDSEDVYENLNGACGLDKSDFSRRNAGNSQTIAPGYTVSRYGLAAIAKNSEIYVYDKDGNLVDTVSRPDGWKYEIKGLDSEHIIYRLRDADYNIHGLYSYDLNTHQEKGLYFETAGETVDVLDFVDSVVYAGITYEKSYCDNVCEIIAFAADGSSHENVGKVESLPGHYHLDAPVGYAFKIMGNTVVYAGETEDTTGLLCSIKQDNGEWVQKDLRIPYMEYSYTKYGTMESQHYEVICPYCNEYYACKYYYEYPVLSSEINNAARINKIIADEAKESMDSAKDYVVYYSEEECKEYYHTGYDNSSIYYSDITGMDTVCGHYLVIYRSHYDMEIGAAHGMFGYRCEIFDLDTGEKASFKDIYKGSEEEFKEIVASAARDQYNNDPDFAEQVFANDDTEIYRGVLEYLSLDWNAFTFYEDYMTVDFDPYMLGSYADGIVSVKITYDKLGLQN